MIQALFIFLTCIIAPHLESVSTIDLSSSWEFSLNGGEPRIVDLPHDWSFEQGYSPDGAQGEQGGYTCGGYGKYTKDIILTKSDISRHVLYIDFDGAYMNSMVSINGQVVGYREYGYISFSYDITKFVHSGVNCIEVTVDNTKEPSARWYHGCGLYGGVNIRVENLLHFIDGSIFATTQNCDEIMSIEFEASSGFSHVEAELSQGEHVIASQKSTCNHFDIKVNKPEFWSPEQPILYDLTLRLYDGRGKCTDVKKSKLGFKSVVWTPDRGLSLNGKPYKIHGVCEHLEGGPVGAAWTKELMRWKLQILKNMGCNSIRTAHNPQLPFFYDLCDELGLLVMDEAFDGWKRKAQKDYGEQAFAECWEKDLRAMIRRDRNHACVYMYSVGNETKGDVALKLIETCHQLDPTRFVTSGSSCPTLMDVCGINGASEKRSFIEEYTPGDKAFIGTETPHTWQVRGYYRTKTWYRDGYPNKGQDPFEIPSLTEKEIFQYDWTAPENKSNTKQVFNSSYDNATVRISARQNIVAQRDNDWYSGYYRWTGFDYLGEAGYVHGGWPFRAFQGGVIDLAGFPKDHYFLYQSEWNRNVDMVHLLPSWTHPGLALGTLIPVWAYTTGDEVELFQDGQSLGRVKKGKEWDKIQCSWMVPWKPGTLDAIAYRNGIEISRAEISTAGEPSSFEVNKESIGEYTLLTFDAKDDHGISYPYADSRVFLHIEDDANVVSFENGSPIDVEKNAGSLSRRLFFGKARAFLRGNADNIIAGMICCDRSLMTSKRAHIVIKGIEDYSVYYSTDGTTPSILFEKPFDVTKGMHIRADVVSNGSVVLSMEEHLDGGLYWGKPESAIIEEVPITNGSGTMTWYQENDGGVREVDISVYYTVNEDCAMQLLNNGIVVSTFCLPATQSSDKPAHITTMLQEGTNELEFKALSFHKPNISRINVL